MTTTKIDSSDSATQATKLEELKSALSKNLEDHKSKLAADLEIRKHELTLSREDTSRSARLAEVIYLEAGQHMRSLNALFWQIPGLAIAVTGGLWFGASTMTDPGTRQWVLWFTALADLLLIIVLFRMRYLFQLSLDFQLAYEASERNARVDSAPKRKGFRYLVVSLWAILLLGASVVSLVGACNPDQVEHYSVRERLRLRVHVDPTPAGISAPEPSPIATMPLAPATPASNPAQVAASASLAPVAAAAPPALASAPTAPAPAAAQAK